MKVAALEATGAQAHRGADQGLAIGRRACGVEGDRAEFRAVVTSPLRQLPEAERHAEAGRLRRRTLRTSPSSPAPSPLAREMPSVPGGDYETAPAKGCRGRPPVTPAEGDGSLNVLRSVDGITPTPLGRHRAGSGRAEQRP